MAGTSEFTPTEKDKARVKRLASFKLPHHEIASLITNPRTAAPISTATLREHFPEELRLGHLELFATVADRYAVRLTGAKAEVDEHGTVVRAEVVPSEQAQLKFLQTFGRQYGWDGATDDPFQGMDLTRLSDGDLKLLKAIAAKARGTVGTD